MAARRLSNVQVELLINLWHNEPSLWDSSSAAYSDGDFRKAAMSRISAALELDVGKQRSVIKTCVLPVYC